MRRTDKEIDDIKVIESILHEADYCFIAMSDNNSPYIVPMNFGFKDHNLYLHSSTEGRKIEILKVNNKVSFGIEVRTQVVKSELACNWSMNFMSVIGEGYAHFIEDTMKRVEALDIIMSKYSNNEAMTSFEYSETALNKVALIRIEIKLLSCKISGYK